MSEIEPLDRDETRSILELMRKKLANEFGVSLVEDNNGAWGRAGTNYLTLRFRDFEITMSIDSISDNRVNQQAEFERESPK